MLSILYTYIPIPIYSIPIHPSTPIPTRKYNGTAHEEHREPHDTIWLVRAPSWRGPYELVGDGPAFRNESFNEEDPCLWRDGRGRFHALFHFTHGHAWSEDGLAWHWGRSAVLALFSTPCFPATFTEARN